MGKREKQKLDLTVLGERELKTKERPKGLRKGGRRVGQDKFSRRIWTKQQSLCNQASLLVGSLFPQHRGCSGTPVASPLQ